MRQASPTQDPSGSSCTVPSAKDLASVTASHTEERQEASEGRDSSIAESSEVALRPGPPLSPLRVRSQAHAEPNMLGSRKASKEAKKGKSPDKQPSNGESLISSRSASSGSLEPPTPFLMISASNSISQLADDTYESNDNKASRPQSLLPGQMPLGAKSEPKGAGKFNLLKHVGIDANTTPAPVLSNLRVPGKEPPQHAALPPLSNPPVPQLGKSQILPVMAVPMSGRGNAPQADPSGRSTQIFGRPTQNVWSSAESNPPDSRRTTDDNGHGGLSDFGSLTGWQRIAMDIMMGGNNWEAREMESSSASFASHCGLDMIMRMETIKPQPGGTFYTDYQILEELGQGAYGKAYRAQRLLDGEIVVAKQIATGGMSMREKQETKQEIKVLAHMDHPNVVKYLAAYAEDTEIIIVMEYCEEGDLTKFLKNRKGRLLEEHQIMLRFVQVCLALHHVHEKGILHRDLKSSNIFCDTYSVVKLGDFGISKVMGAEAQARTIVGTPYYLSPEICEDKPYGVKSDIWSLGCVLYELCTLHHAFDGKSLPQLVLKILAGKFPPIAGHYSDDLKNLVNSLLARNPSDRPQLQDIFKLAYVRNHLHRYVVHIKKHIVKRKDSFKRSVAKWDPIYNTTHMDGTSETGKDNKEELIGTIAKRQNSEGYFNDSMGATLSPNASFRAEAAQRPAADGGKSLRRASNPSRRVFIMDGDGNISKPGDSQSGDRDAPGNEANLSMALGKAGIAMLRLGLPPSRFEGEHAEENSSTEAPGPESLMHMLPATNWNPAPKRGQGNPRAADEGSSLADENDSAKDVGIADGSEAGSDEAPLKLSLGRSMKMDETIKRLIDAGAPTATAIAVADALEGRRLTRSSNGSCNFDLSNYSAPEPSEQSALIMPDESKRISSCRSSRGSDTTQGGYCESDIPQDPAEDEGLREPNNGSERENLHADSASACTGDPVDNLQGLSPLKLATARSLSLGGSALESSGSGVPTPQFRMQALQHCASQSSNGDGPRTVRSLQSWGRSNSRSDDSRSSLEWDAGSATGPIEAPPASHCADVGSAEPAKQNTRATRFAAEAANAETSAGQAPQPKAGAQQHGAAVTGGMPETLQDLQVAEARAEKQKYKQNYAAVKAQREADAAAKASAHRKQLVEAKAVKDKAKAVAAAQAATWVHMLRKRVEFAAPRVPSRLQGTAGKPEDSRGSKTGPSQQQPPPLDEQADHRQESDIPWSRDTFLRDVSQAARDADAVQQVYAMLDNICDLMEDPPEEVRSLSLSVRKLLATADLEAMKRRIGELHKKAKVLLGEDVFEKVRSYIWDSMNAEHDGNGQDTQGSFLAMVGEENMAHLPLVLKTVRQEVAYAEAMAANKSGGDRKS